MERKRLAKAVEILDFEVATMVRCLKQADIEDNLNDALITEVNVSVRAKSPSGPSLVVILVMRRGIKTFSLQKG